MELVIISCPQSETNPKPPVTREPQSKEMVGFQKSQKARLSLKLSESHAEGCRIQSPASPAKKRFSSYNRGCGRAPRRAAANQGRTYGLIWPRCKAAFSRTEV